ncbi:MAG: MarR family winged helix-turn-helix transcriptional regulator [Pseudolabrys sp.]
MTAKRATLSDHHTDAWVRLVRASDRLVQHVEAALKAAGLPALAWYDVLLELRRAEPNGARPFQLQQEMLLQQYNMSRLIDRVVAAGLARRLDCDEDGRGQVIRITAEGLKLLKAMWPVYRGVLEQELAARLGDSEAKSLAELLAKLVDRKG